MSKHSSALVISIIIQFIAIIIAFTSFFLPIYQIKFSVDVELANGASELEFRYRGYQCSITTSLDSNSEPSKFSYDESPDLDCLPFLTPDEDMTRFGFYMKVSLAVLALGFIGSVFTLLFTIIMSCHNTCRNIAMKFFAFIFSLVPFVFYLASPLVLLKLTYDFYIYGEQSSQSDGNENCGGYWCQSFYGKETAEFSIPGIPGAVSGELQWGPTYGWASGIIASILALLSAILTVCSARYKKHHHHHHHHHDDHHNVQYSRLINQE